MTRSRTTRIALALVCALVFVAGGYLVVHGLREAPPEETPTPEAEFSLTVEEALSLDRAAADEPLEIPDGLDLGPFVNTEPVVVPGPGAAAPAAETDESRDVGGQSGEDPGAAHHLYVPSIYVSAPIVPQGVTSSNEMSLPDDLHQVGFLDTTSSLGATEGSTLIAGHVTQQGNHGALYFLGKVRPGATVVTTDEAGTPTRWAVTSVHNYRKTSLPDEVFDTTGPRTLTLVTCGGEIIRTDDGRWTHTDNIVVTATPLP